jgi:hypothetical protein
VNDREVSSSSLVVKLLDWDRFTRNDKLGYFVTSVAKYSPKSDFIIILILIFSPDIQKFSLFIMSKLYHLLTRSLRLGCWRRPTRTTGSHLSRTSVATCPNRANSTSSSPSTVRLHALPRTQPTLTPHTTKRHDTTRPTTHITLIDLSKGKGPSAKPAAQAPAQPIGAAAPYQPPYGAQPAYMGGGQQQPPYMGGGQQQPPYMGSGQPMMQPPMQQQPQADKYPGLGTAGSSFAAPSPAQAYPPPAGMPGYQQPPQQPMAQAPGRYGGQPPMGGAPGAPP